MDTIIHSGLPLCQYTSKRIFLYFLNATGGILVDFQSAEFIHLIHEAPKLFGRLLEELCMKAGLHQAHLSKKADIIRKQFIDNGVILPGDPLIGSMYQPAISRVMSGEQRPTYGQVLIWLHVIKKWYVGPELRKACKIVEIEYDIEMPVPQFDGDLEQDLWYLALFGKPSDIVQAYERRKNYHLLNDNLPPLIKTRANNLPTVRQRRQEKEEKQTDVLPTLRTRQLKDTGCDLPCFSPNFDEICANQEF